MKDRFFRRAPTLHLIMYAIFNDVYNRRKCCSYVSLTLIAIKQQLQLLPVHVSAANPSIHRGSREIWNGV